MDFRLFDSQNNARGGYNVGEPGYNIPYWRMYFYSGSNLAIEWTNQHSCNDSNNFCEIIVQYMCGAKVRDGTEERTIPDNKDETENNSYLRYGMHENYNYYQDCKYTERNHGLYLADQKLRGHSAKYTRQNPRGTRHGYECPEEKDYYPYWRPSPWKDVAIMTNNVERCELYERESQNVKSRFACILPEEMRKKLKEERRNRRKTIPISKEKCEAFKIYDKDANGKWTEISANGTWTEFPSHKIPAPKCIQSKWSRDNHNGNGMGGFMNKYIWEIPKDLNEENCVLRMRYNISTNDYSSWEVTANTEKGGINIAFGKPTKQSSEGWGGSPSRAVDGNRYARYWGRSCTHTRKDQGAWWRVDLGQTLPVRRVNIVNREDCCSNRLSNFEIRVGNEDDSTSATNKLCAKEQGALGRGEVRSFACSENLEGRYVFVKLLGRNYLTLCEVEVISDPEPSVNELLANKVSLAPEDAKNRGYVFKGNPEIQILKDQTKLTLRLAINTAQYGRTFQDRTHVFDIKKRPDDIPKDAKIYNLNVRGKRGNAQQVYPAVEYDFVPNRLEIEKNDYIHIQWTGADTNPRNNAGQGRRGEDRSNIVLLKAQNYPEGTLGAISPTKFGHFGNNYPEHLDNAKYLGFNQDDKIDLAHALGRPYFDLGLKQTSVTGTYFYFSTRNNAFTNRSQKGKIVVKAKASSEDTAKTSAYPSAVASAKVQADLPDDEQGVSVLEDTISKRPIKVEEWSRKRGEDYIKSKGGKMDQGDDYASNFMVILPMEDLTKDDTKFEVNMKTYAGGKSKRTVYHSLDAKTWHEVDDVFIDEKSGMASFDASKGGLYVARIRKDETKKDEAKKSLKEKLESMQT